MQGPRSCAPNVVGRLWHDAGLLHAEDESGRRPVGDAVRYIEARLGHMDHASANARGLPIGSYSIRGRGP